MVSQCCPAVPVRGGTAQQKSSTDEQGERDGEVGGFMHKAVHLDGEDGAAGALDVRCRCLSMYASETFAQMTTNQNGVIFA